MSGRLNEMKAVITGGSEGLGLAMAAAFVAEGAEVWLVARNQNTLAAVAEGLSANGGKVRFSAVELLDPTAVNELGREIAEAWNQLDVLVNNAGMARFTKFSDVTAEEMQAQVQMFASLAHGG